MRLIDADALLDFIDAGHLRHPSELCFSEIDVANMLLHATTVSPDEVRGVGEWIHKPHIHGVVYCSECDYELRVDDTNYCPNCGAKMEVTSDA